MMPNRINHSTNFRSIIDKCVKLLMANNKRCSFQEKENQNIFRTKNVPLQLIFSDKMNEF